MKKGPAAPLEMGHRYIDIMMKFYGIPTLEGIFIEGHNAFPEKAEQIKEKAIAQAKDMAHAF